MTLNDPSTILSLPSLCFPPHYFPVPLPPLASPDPPPLPLPPQSVVLKCHASCPPKRHIDVIFLQK